MDYRIQTIIIPTDDTHMVCRDLFYHGENGYLDQQKRTLTVILGQQIDFLTYMNACSWGKWKKLTGAKNVKIHLDAEGPCRLRFIGYHEEYWELVREVFEVVVDERTEKREIVYTFPDNDETIVGVEISPLATCTVYGGYYSVEVDEETMTPVDLSIATTTFRREKYIKKNIDLLKSELMDGDDEIRDHLYIHVVDNGRTLTSEEIESRNIWLHQNPNVGGAGGYARGMIESLHQNPEPTHVLLMDDDVLVLPESIRRTYHLLRLLKPEYRDNFVAGAMLKLEKPMMFHEDIGRVYPDGRCGPLKPTVDLSWFLPVVETESAWYNGPNQYAGWWHCCIPVKAIKENGLPLPVFIRGDDVEYSLRCKAKILTMNGICIWQPGFDLKYNPAMDCYQDARNRLIAQAASGVAPEINFFEDFHTRMLYEIERFEYNAAELILKAFEDYMKGPEYLMKLNGESLIKENAATNEKPEPLSSHPEIQISSRAALFDDVVLGRKDRWLRKITRNGHRLTPERLYREGCPTGVYGWGDNTNKLTLMKQYAAVNPFEETVVIRRLDKERYKKWNKRYKAFMKDWKNRGSEVAASWRKAQPQLVSEEFWQKYLGGNQ